MFRTAVIPLACCASLSVFAGQRSRLRVHNQRRHAMFVAIRALGCTDIALYQPGHAREFPFDHQSNVSVGVFFNVTQEDQAQIRRDIAQFDRSQAEGIPHHLCSIPFTRKLPNYVVTFLPEVQGTYEVRWKHSRLGPLYYCSVKRRLERHRRFLRSRSRESMPFVCSAWNEQRGCWESDVERVANEIRALFGLS